MMKKILLIAALFYAVLINAQTETYTVAGKVYELRKDVQGPLTLLWNTMDRNYRYFALKDGVITELVNTKGQNGYQEEYKKTLNNLTANTPVETTNLKLTLGSLRLFFNNYNRLVDASYVSNSILTAPECRISVFGGITNSIFTRNPENAKNPQAGLAFEILDPASLPRHAIVFQVEQTFATNEFDYKSLQFSLNYRFKFIKHKAIDLFVNTKLVTFTSFDKGLYVDANETILPSISGSSFQAPVIMGLGADIRMGKGFLTLEYRDALSIFLEDNNAFPLDLNIGYKFVL